MRVSFSSNDSRECGERDNILWANERKSGLVNFQREGERDRSEDVKRLRYIGVFLSVDGRRVDRFEKRRRKATVFPVSLHPTTNE